MGTTDGGMRGGASARLAFMVACAVLCVAVIVASGMEWGSLSVRRRLVVSEPGTAGWQGILALVAAIIGLLAISLAVSRGSGRVAALIALVTGAAVAAAAAIEVVHLVTRPSDLAAVVESGARAIDLKGYRVPLIESAIGAGTWITLAAGATLALAGLVAVVVPAWRGRRGRA